MQSYQVYGLDQQGRIVQPPAAIFCATDGALYAKALAAGQAVEVRDRTRMVMRIEAIPGAPYSLGRCGSASTTGS
jgi:hypothetical protein